jgi:hypothetical protein
VTGLAVHISGLSWIGTKITRQWAYPCMGTSQRIFTNFNTLNLLSQNMLHTHGVHHFMAQKHIMLKSKRTFLNYHQKRSTAYINLEAHLFIMQDGDINLDESIKVR